jgi:hypothetical protein
VRGGLAVMPDPVGESPDRRHKARWWRHLSQFEAPTGSDGRGGARAAGAKPGAAGAKPGAAAVEPGPRWSPQTPGPRRGAGGRSVGRSQARRWRPRHQRQPESGQHPPYCISRRNLDEVGGGAVQQTNRMARPGSLHGTLEFVTYSATSRLMVGPRRAGWSARCLASSARARGQPTAAESWVDSTFNRP